jgi:hypothetical protein
LEKEEVMKKQLGLMIALIFLVFSVTSFVSAYQINSNVNLQVSCMNINCSNSVNVTILYPDSSKIVDNLGMTINAGYANYTFVPDKIGEYSYFADDAEKYYSGIIEVTQSGEDYSTTNWLPIVIILFGIIIVLAFLAINLASDHGFIAIFFLLLALFLTNPLLGIANIIVNNGYSNTALIGQLDVFNTICPWIMYGTLMYIVIYVFIKMIESWDTKKKFRLGLETTE